jgi:hypothetical protein
MPARRQIIGPDPSVISYRSTACQIGTHRSCTESTPGPAPTDLPLIYEACGCLCHAASDRSRGEGDAARNSTSGGEPAPDVAATEERAQT